MYTHRCLGATHFKCSRGFTWWNSRKSIFYDNFWLECPTDLRSTCLSCIFRGLFRDTPLGYVWRTLPNIQIAKYGQILDTYTYTIYVWKAPKIESCYTIFGTKNERRFFWVNLSPSVAGLLTRSKSCPVDVFNQFISELAQLLLLLLLVVGSYKSGLSSKTGVLTKFFNLQ